MKYAPNGYALSLVLKRNLSFREANFIAVKILGISTELTFDDLSDDKEGLFDSKKQLVSDIENLITGECGFDYISDNWAMGDALEDLYPSIFFAMLKYLIDKDIIQ